MRGLEFLLTRPELDTSRVVVLGNDLALITAALHPGATHVVTTPALFYDTVALAQKTTAYPLEEINDYLRAFPAQAEAVQRRWPTTTCGPLRPACRPPRCSWREHQGHCWIGQALAHSVKRCQGR